MHEIPAAREQQRSIRLYLKQSKLCEVENNTSLMRLEPMIVRLRVDCSNRWAMGIWRFPIHGVGYWPCRYRYFCLQKLTKMTAVRGLQHSFRQWTDERIKWYEAENSAILMMLEPTPPRLHTECSNCWATGIRHFPMNGYGYWPGDIDIFVCIF